MVSQKATLYNASLVARKILYSVDSHVFDHMTLIFLYKPINYGVTASLYGVACEQAYIMPSGYMVCKYNAT